MPPIPPISTILALFR